MSDDNTTTNGGLRFPARRTDGETMKDRLTANAYDKILPARYLQHDENGNVIEDQEDVFERVAKNIALAELVYDDRVRRVEGRHIADHHRTEEVFEEVFGTPEPVDRGVTALTEDTVKYFSYDKLVADDEYDTRAAEAYKEDFQYDMEHLQFIPNTPTIINAGTNLQQLSACFVTSPEDDMDDIHQTAKDASIIFQTGGGVGYAFSDLRPYGDTVGSTGGIASGPMTFMKTFDQICGTVQQGGVRRGAQMGVMQVDHPDIPFFLHAKNRDVSLAQTLKLNDPDDPQNADFGEALEEARDLIDDEGRVPPHLRNAVEGHLSNFNISVAVTDEFMDAVEAGGEITMENPRTGEAHIATEETVDMYEWFDLGEYVEEGEPLSVPAEEIWTRIAEGAHENGEPGVVYIDRFNDEHGYDVEKHPEYEIKSTNPCAEQGLIEDEACNLGHINLSLIRSGDAVPFDEFDTGNGDLETRVGRYLTATIHWEKFNRLIEDGTRFLDNVVTMSDFPIEKIARSVENNRKIGLGIMGLAQLFVQMGIEYGSEAGNEAARQLMRHINQYSKKCSNYLAEERGTFENYEDSKWANPTEYPDFFERHTGMELAEHTDGYPMRNYNTTTIAPTGTTSMLGDTTGGCEPFFNVAYYKNVTDDIQGDEMLVEFDSYFLDVLEANDIDVESVKAEAEAQMTANEFDGIASLSDVPEQLAHLFVGASDLTATEHAAVQCACQEGVDSSISKTTNAAYDSTVEDAKDVFEYIYEHGGKAVTYYRDGSRTKQVLTTRSDNQDVSDDESGAEGEDVGEDMEAAESAETDADAPRVDEGGSDGEAPTPAVATGEIRERPAVLESTTERIETSNGGMYVTISEDEAGPFEVFAQIGKSGGFTQSMLEAIARLISLNLRSGVSPENVVDQLRGIRGPNVAWDKGLAVNSIPDGLGIALERHMERENERRTEPKTDGGSVAEAETGTEAESIGPSPTMEGRQPECGECGAMLEIVEGCEKCPSCGYSKC